MKLFAIGDLHLGHQVNKPMDIFSSKWQDHTTKLKEAWLEKITEEDVVIICGDISWGMRLEQAMEDLKFLNDLPGEKICIKGNHDYWWQKIGQLNSLFEHIHFLQNTAYVIGDYVICGTRGWLCPQDESMDEEDYKIYIREGTRLELSLKEARKYPDKQCIVALHYPPTNSSKDSSVFTQLLTKYQVGQVVYGHLHHEEDWAKCVQGQYDGVFYTLVAADYLDFVPKLIGAREEQS